MTPVIILHVWSNLLHNSAYGAVVCGSNSGSNINILTIAELSLISHSAPTFPSKEGWEVRGGTQQGQLIWIRQGDVLYHTASSTAVNVLVEEERGKGVSSEFMVAQRIPEHWSACGRWWVTAFASLGSLFVWSVFFFPLHLLNCLSTHRFSCFFLPVLCPIVLVKEWGHEWVAGWVLTCWAGLTHHNWKWSCEIPKRKRINLSVLAALPFGDIFFSMFSMAIVACLCIYKRFDTIGVIFAFPWFLLWDLYWHLTTEIIGKYQTTYDNI